MEDTVIVEDNTNKEPISLSGSDKKGFIPSYSLGENKQANDEETYKSVYDKFINEQRIYILAIVNYLIENRIFSTKVPLHKIGMICNKNTEVLRLHGLRWVPLNKGELRGEGNEIMIFFDGSLSKH